MTTSTKTFSTLVSDAVTAIQGAASSLVDMSVGSILRALVEAHAFVVLWLQAVALEIAARTRFATSSGEDADSWAADYGFTRLPAVAASGAVTFSRFTSTAAATVPVGTIVQTADGSQKYAVIADTSRPAYSAGAGGYALPIGTASALATVRAITAAAGGNAAAGAINTMGVSIAGVDTVTNGAGFTNGADQESDTDMRARFVLYLANLAKATPGAIASAVESVQQGGSFTLTEQEDYAGNALWGYFYVVADDGTGTPSALYLNAVAAAVDLVRPVGSGFGVFGPALVSANVAMTLTTAGGYTHSAVVADVTAALTDYINGLGLGVALQYSRLAAVAYSASAGVTNVTGVTLNGGTADLAATKRQRVMPGTLTVS